ncbi:hypothetical protein Lesp02_12380 [Lentzea sp. NBRC 105346]|uniref:lasso RiPP family leader peptide-containing protein n=1 Tax=Lentzea sp. NBRC 105346 TaxID=3032205 RepID=UPI0024A444CB|nr:hypothetical protein Lesp02_12380 [Lentzea sp. NBRC 105346]
MATTRDDEGFREAVEGVPQIVDYEPPAVFDAGKVSAVTHGNSSGSNDANGRGHG